MSNGNEQEEHQRAEAVDLLCAAYELLDYEGKFAISHALDRMLLERELKAEGWQEGGGGAQP